MSKYMDVALKAVKEAEEYIMSKFGGSFDVQTKSDSSPVTEVDQAAEKIIKKVISEAFPDHGFIGEEGGEEGDSDYKWIIDPIDGTKAFIRGLPLFSTQLALWHNGEVIVGVSNGPAMGELMYAEKGQGAFLNGKKVVVSGCKELKSSYLSHGGLDYFRQRKLVSTLVDLYEDTKFHRGIGDWWSCHLVAQGKMDVMIDAQCKIWDVAALLVIVQEAGGKMTGFDGKPIGLDADCYIASNGHLHDEIVKRFSSS